VSDAARWSINKQSKMMNTECRMGGSNDQKAR
jgi:hypothetical protein